MYSPYSDLRNLRQDPGSQGYSAICAVNRGRCFYEGRKERRCGYTHLMVGYGSHIAPNGLEWIVFNEKRVVPLCVMRVRREHLNALLGHVGVQPGCGANPKFRRLVPRAVEAASGGNGHFQAFRRDVHTDERKAGFEEAEDVVAQIRNASVVL